MPDILQYPYTSKRELLYSKSGMAHSDFVALDVARSLKWRNVHTASDVVILAFQVLIKRGEFSLNEVTVLYGTGGEHVVINFDETGSSLEPFPSGFCSQRQELLNEYLEE
jgi:hypothetical protein